MNSETGKDALIVLLAMCFLVTMTLLLLNVGDKKFCEGKLTAYETVETDGREQ